MEPAGFSSQQEFEEFLIFLDGLCRPAAHEVVRGESVKLRFGFSTLESPLGYIDVFRYQSEAGWGSPDPYTAQAGQGLFRYSGSVVEVNDLCDSGWKYMLPYPELLTHGSAEGVPTLKELAAAIRQASNITERFQWKGP